jgi:hypothetical protein
MPGAIYLGVAGCAKQAAAALADSKRASRNWGKSWASFDMRVCVATTNL